MLEIKNVKKIQIRRSRFGYESESEYYSSCKNHESESEYSGFVGKDSNLNPSPNICYNSSSHQQYKVKLSPVSNQINYCLAERFLSVNCLMENWSITIAGFQ